MIQKSNKSKLQLSSFSSIVNISVGIGVSLLLNHSASAQTLIEATAAVYDYDVAYPTLGDKTLSIVTDLVAEVPTTNTGDEHWILLGSFVGGTSHKLDISMYGSGANSSASVSFNYRWNTSPTNISAALDVFSLSQKSFQRFFELHAFRTADQANYVHVFLKYTPSAGVRTTFSARATSLSAYEYVNTWNTNRTWRASDVANISSMIGIIPMVGNIDQQNATGILNATESVPAPVSGISFNKKTQFNDEVNIMGGLTVDGSSVLTRSALQNINITDTLSVGNGNAIGENSIAVGDFPSALGNRSLAIGELVFTQGDNSVAIGDVTSSIGDNSVAMGDGASSIGRNSFAGGQDTKAFGENSFTSGLGSYSSGDNSFASGYSTYADGENSVSLGKYTYTSGDNSFASGDYTYAGGENSVAIGDYTSALGLNSVAMGLGSYAIGDNSISSGRYVSISQFAAAAFGQYNENIGISENVNTDDAWVGDDLNSVFEVGIGSNFQNRKNAMTIMQDGTIELGKDAVTNEIPLKVSSDGSVTLSKAQGDISMGIYGQ